jgi:hemerythrin
MSRITWDESMSVGVKIIDAQHKTLIDGINSFYDAIGTSSGKDLTIDLLNKMKEYSLFHFNSEEQLLNKHGYPELEYQKKEHKTFIGKVDDLDRRLKAGKLVVSLELTSFIKSWITNHIMVNDKKYTAFLNSKGVY